MSHVDQADLTLRGTELGDMTGWGRFCRVAQDAPDRIGLWQGDRVLRLGELRDRALRMAAATPLRDLVPGDRVVLFAANGGDLAAAYLAIWRQGGVPVMVGHESPDSHFQHAVSLTRPRFVLVSEDHVARAGRLDLPVPVVALTGHDGGDPSEAASVRAEDIASIVFTSGSTGAPKGVMQTHAGLISACDSLRDHFGYNAESDRLLCPVPWAHDYGWGQVQFLLFAGLPLILPEGPGTLPVTEAIARHRPTIFAGVPSLFASLLLGISNIRQTDCSSIRVITSTGSAMPETVLAALTQVMPDAGLRLNFGLSETYRSTSLDPRLTSQHPRAAGQAVPGVRIWIRQPDGHEAAPGETGEVIHCGLGAFAGYYDNPQATARVRFVDPDTGQVSVHTGDLGALDERGILTLSGRIDRQIKTMGIRVSPDEIENCLLSSNLLRDVAIIATPHDTLGQQIACVYVPRDPAAGRSIERDLRMHVQRILGNFMTPRRFLSVDALPRTYSGKTDYPALESLLDPR